MSLNTKSAVAAAVSVALAGAFALPSLAQVGQTFSSSIPDGLKAGTGAPFAKGHYAALDKLGRRKRVLALPPDFTRFHSKAGEFTEYAWNYYGEALTDVLPALGTHKPMTDEEIRRMEEIARKKEIEVMQV